MEQETSASASAHAPTKQEDGRRLALLLRTVICALALPAVGGCVSTQESAPPPNAIRLGTVLPFSGERAGSGVALETAVRLAIEIVNSAQALGGRQLWLDVRDSHSDDARGTANALDLINQGEIPFFIGTEEPRIAFEITTAIKSHQMVHLMPGLTSAQFHDPSAHAAWFRFSPAVSYLACALAKHMRNDGIDKANLVTGPDDYSSAFATAFDRTFTWNGGTVAPNLEVDPGHESLADLFTTLGRLSTDATVLVTSPATAATLLQEWAVRGKPVKWYLGPTLNNPELLKNVPMGVLDGVQGISADLGERAQSFDSFFQARSGVPPLAGAHYYFDAVVLLALALQEAIVQTGQFPSPAVLKDHMLNVTASGRTAVAFDQIPLALQLLAAGERIEYQGAAGFYVLNSLGDSTQTRGMIWEIAGSSFSSLDYQQCTPEEVGDTSID
jgi:ABC-type branched-subunit amino acid transport system substrate-binding protein